VKRLDFPEPHRPETDGGVTCLVIDSASGVGALTGEFPSTFRDSVDEVTRRVRLGCVLCVARLKRADGTPHEVIGYELAERGVFSAMGRRKAVGRDVVFSHWAEVLPAYRGRRVHGLLFAARDAYFRARGGKMIVGVCAPRNRSSLHALKRDGAVVVGRVKQISMLSLIVWETPWARIEAALEIGRRLGSLSHAAPIEDFAPRHA